MEWRRQRRWSRVQCPVDALSKVKVGEPTGPPPNHTMPCNTIQYIPHQTYHTIPWAYIYPKRPTTMLYHTIMPCYTIQYILYTTLNISYHTMRLCMSQTAHHQPYYAMLYHKSIPYHPYHTTLWSVSQPPHHQNISWHNLLYHTLPTILKEGYLTIPLNLSCWS